MDHKEIEILKYDIDGMLIWIIHPPLKNERKIIQNNFVFDRVNVTRRNFLKNIFFFILVSKILIDVPSFASIITFLQFAMISYHD